MIRTINFDHNEKRGALRAMLGLLNERVQFSVAPRTVAGGCRIRSHPRPQRRPRGHDFTAPVGINLSRGT